MSTSPTIRPSPGRGNKSEKRFLTTTPHAIFLRDRDGVYGSDFGDMLKGFTIEEVVSAPQSPWQKDYASYCTSLA
jgi:hypothetical protein